MKVIDRYLQESRSFDKKNSVKGLVFHGDRMLMLRRANEDKGGGNWDVPGGAIESGENPIDALKREIFEETNLKINSAHKLESKLLKIPEEGVNSVMTFYKCKTDEFTVLLKPATWKGSNGRPEHTEFKWISDKVELENMKMIDQLRDILIQVLK